MYGLEKKKKTAIFEFALEKELKESPEKAKQKLQMIEGKIQEIKDLLRKGGKSEDFDQLGVLLQAYVALQKVLTKVTIK